MLSHLLSLALLQGSVVEAVGDCGPQQRLRWKFVDEYSNGVGVGDEPGMPTNERSEIGATYVTDGAHEWRPLAPRKLAICGRLSRFGVFVGLGDWPRLRAWLPVTIPEVDWNLTIQPKAAHAARLDFAKTLMTDAGTLHDLESCFGQNNNCFEAEVTAPAALRDFSEWQGPASVADSGGDFCAYGPWVTDSAHGNKPELHPAERIWWRIKGTPEEHYLALIQDGSARFVKTGNLLYLRNKDEKNQRSRNQPWAAGPLTGAFDLAFKVAPRERLHYVVQVFQDHAQRVPGSSGAFFYDQWPGLPAETPDVRVLGARTTFNLDPKTLKVSVDPRSVCREKSDGSLRGFVRFESRVGCENCGEGFSFLRVRAIRQTGVHEPPKAGAAPSKRDSAGAVTLSPSLDIKRIDRIAVDPPAPKERCLLAQALSFAAVVLSDSVSTGATSKRTWQEPNPLPPVRRTTGWRIKAAPHYVGSGSRRLFLNRALEHGSTSDLLSLLCLRDPFRESNKWCGSSQSSAGVSLFAFANWRWAPEDTNFTVSGFPAAFDLTCCASNERCHDSDARLDGAARVECRVPICVDDAAGKLDPGCPTQRPHVRVSGSQTPGSTAREWSVLLPSTDHVYLVMPRTDIKYTSASGFTCRAGAQDSTADPVAGASAEDWRCEPGEWPLLSHVVDTGSPGFRLWLSQTMDNTRPSMSPACGPFSAEECDGYKKWLRDDANDLLFQAYRSELLTPDASTALPKLLARTREEKANAWRACPVQAPDDPKR